MELEQLRLENEAQRRDAERIAVQRSEVATVVAQLRDAILWGNTTINSVISDREAAHRYITDREFQCLQYHAKLKKQDQISVDTNRTLDAANQALSSFVERLRNNLDLLKVRKIQ
jgi:hypothetical protein